MASSTTLKLHSFLKWNLPYAAMRHCYAQPFDHLSPSDHPTPSSNIVVASPFSGASPNTAPSPTTMIAREYMMVDRARMFAQGQHEKLLTVLNGDERR